MDLEEGLLTRRSVRQFQSGKKISKQNLEDMLRAAMYAPSARNCQPWEFLVINDKNIFQEIMAIHPYCSFLADADLAVIVCGNLSEQCDDNYWIGDCAAATENLLLSVHAQDLGACWCGIYPVEERVKAFIKLFDLPKNIMPFALVVIGHPLQPAKQPKDRYNPEKVHYNGW